jgi:hypothetical protein
MQGITMFHPPNELGRTVLENEMRAEDQDHSHWMYRLEKDQPTRRRNKEVVETEEGWPNG